MIHPVLPEPRNKPHFHRDEEPPRHLGRAISWGIIAGILLTVAFWLWWDNFSPKASRVRTVASRQAQVVAPASVPDGVSAPPIPGPPIDLPPDQIRARFQEATQEVSVELAPPGERHGPRRSRGVAVSLEGRFLLLVPYGVIRGARSVRVNGTTLVESAWFDRDRNWAAMPLPNDSAPNPIDVSNHPGELAPHRVCLDGSAGPQVSRSADSLGQQDVCLAVARGDTPSVVQITTANNHWGFDDLRTRFANPPARFDSAQPASLAFKKILSKKIEGSREAEAGTIELPQNGWLSGIASSLPGDAIPSALARLSHVDCRTRLYLRGRSENIELGILGTVEARNGETIDNLPVPAGHYSLIAENVNPNASCIVSASVSVRYFE